MSVDRCKGIAEASGFFDVLSCKKSSIRLRSLERPPAIVLIETIRAVLNSRMRPKFGLKDIGFMILNPER
jgi:hypothetical protein